MLYQNLSNKVVIEVKRVILFVSFVPYSILSLKPCTASRTFTSFYSVITLSSISVKFPVSSECCPSTRGQSARNYPVLYYAIVAADFLSKYQNYLRCCLVERIRPALPDCAQNSLSQVHCDTEHREAVIIHIM